MAENNNGMSEKEHGAVSSTASKSRVIKRNRSNLNANGEIPSIKETLHQGSAASVSDDKAAAPKSPKIIIRKSSLPPLPKIIERASASSLKSDGVRNAQTAGTAGANQNQLARGAAGIVSGRPVSPVPSAPVAPVAPAASAVPPAPPASVADQPERSASSPAASAGNSEKQGSSSGKPQFLKQPGEVIAASAGRFTGPKIFRDERSGASASSVSPAASAPAVKTGSAAPAAAAVKTRTSSIQTLSSEVVIPARKRFTIIKDSQNLPPIRTAGTSTSGRSMMAGIVGGRSVDGRGRFGQQRNSSQGSGGFGRTPFKVASMNKAFEISQPSPGAKRKGPSSSKKGNYRGEKVQDEREFDVAKKKKINFDTVPKKIDIMNYITPGELARKMNLKAGDIISKLISMGSMVTINEQIDSDTATIIANEFGCEVHIVDLYQETLIENVASSEENMQPRAPIVTVMGHVDHGKTKLLDAIRLSDVVSGEAGGITQHIGAYKVSNKRTGSDIVFIDTPGHAAFSAMRARGAKVTDIVVLVVAANDGVMPQTVEAIEHAKAAKVPIIVAINKCDLPEANPDRVMQQLSEYNLIPEEWGGETQFVKISAKKREGIDDLLDSIIVQAEMLDLKADPTIRATGTILEAKIDQGRGVVATVLVKEGTLNKGDNFVVGIYQGHVKTMTNDKGEKVAQAFPSDPVEITGLSDVPKAGDPFQVTEDEHTAKVISVKRQELERLGQLNSFKRVSLDNVYDTISKGDIPEFNIIIKGDVQGSVEAISAAIQKLETPLIKPVILRSQAGAIIEDDINLASSVEGGALIIAFNVRPTPRAQAKAEAEKIEIKKYAVIYDIIDDIKSAMEGKLSPVKKEMDIGKLEVRQIFKVPKVGIVAGCMVVSGKITRKSYVRVIRDNIQISQNPVKLTSLKRFKDDVKDVLEGFECGAGLENFQDLQVGDILEAVEVVEVAQSLDFSDGAVI